MYPTYDMRYCRTFSPSYGFYIKGWSKTPVLCALNINVFDPLCKCDSKNRHRFPWNQGSHGVNSIPILKTPNGKQRGVISSGFTSPWNKHWTQCRHQYLQCELQYAHPPLCFQWHRCKRPSHLSPLPSLTMSFLSEINNKMLYYGEQQELSSEEISEKLVLAQKMLEEIRSRQPFFIQRELVDEEADEAHECRSIQLPEPSSCLLSLWIQERTQRHRQYLVKTASSEYSQLFGTYMCPQGIIQHSFTI